MAPEQTSPLVSDESTKEPHGDVKGHMLVLVVCVAMLSLAFIITPVAPGRPKLSVKGATLPPLCMLKSTTGRDCPGCGMTRSWVAAAHGDMISSLNYHRLGWLFMLYTALQVVRQSLWLALPGLRQRLAAPGRILDRTLFVFAGLLMLNWLLKVAGI